jgi:hypothetical protein
VDRPDRMKFAMVAVSLQSIAVTQVVPDEVHQVVSLAVTYELDSGIVDSGYVPGNREAEVALVVRVCSRIIVRARSRIISATAFEIVAGIELPDKAPGENKLQNFGSCCE